MKRIVLYLAITTIASCKDDSPIRVDSVSKNNVYPGEVITVLGPTMEMIDAISINGLQVEICDQNSSEITFYLPESDVPPGSYELVVTENGANLNTKLFISVNDIDRSLGWMPIFVGDQRGSFCEPVISGVSEATNSIIQYTIFPDIDAFVCNGGGWGYQYDTSNKIVYTTLFTPAPNFEIFDFNKELNENFEGSLSVFSISGGNRVPLEVIKRTENLIVVEGMVSGERMTAQFVRGLGQIDDFFQVDGTDYENLTFYCDQ